MNKKVSCPTCGTSVEWLASSNWKPFCSERCKLIDLGEWIDEKYRITQPGNTKEFVSAAIPTRMMTV